MEVGVEVASECVVLLDEAALFVAVYELFVKAVSKCS